MFNKRKIGLAFICPMIMAGLLIKAIYPKENIAVNTHNQSVADKQDKIINKNKNKDIRTQKETVLDKKIVNEKKPTSKSPEPSDVEPWVTSEEIRLPEASLSTLAQRHADGEPVELITFPGPSGESLVVQVDKVDLSGVNSGTFTGTIEGYPDSDVVLSFVNNAQAGTIEDPSRSLYLSYEAYADNQVKVQSLDMQKLQEYADCDSPKLHGIDPNHHHSSY